MKLKTIKKRIVIYLVNHTLAGTRFFSEKRNLLRSIGYEIGENTKIVGPIYNTGTLHIGANCWIGCNLTVHGNGTVTIGDNCDIAPDVTFLTGGHQMGNHSRRAGKGESYHNSISLEVLSEEATAVVSIEDEYMEQISADEAAVLVRLLRQGLSSHLTETQRRRLWKYCVEGKPVRLIAKEKCAYRNAVWKSIQAAKEKMFKFLVETGCAKPRFRRDR